jgi:hypothetical protein
MHEFDLFMRNLIEVFRGGISRRKNPGYRRVQLALEKAQKATPVDTGLIRSLSKELWTLPSGDQMDPNYNQMDPNYKRCTYLRYADDCPKPPV